jgi:hypothetical protein
MVVVMMTITIAYLDIPILVDQQIRRLQITMHDLRIGTV